ncbi:ATP-binding protein [Kitasatospora sp. NPDC048365]|uniref:ATP-binding protein n=1 Tax=Kitasatospora sp. NPDC048365 TaxID=3364050 RepID=UPI0037241405
MIPPDPRQVARLRAAARCFLQQCHPKGCCHIADVLLVVSELATNVVNHTDGPGRLVLVSDPQGTEIRVTDSSRRGPRPQPPSATRPSGRGLVLIREIGTAVDVTPDIHGGKTVRVYVADRSADPAQPPAGHAPRPGVREP